MSGDPLLGFIIEGDALKLLNSGSGMADEFIDDPIDGKYVRTVSTQPADGVALHAGTALAFLPDTGEAWQGHTVYFSVVMRKPSIKGSDDVLLRFYYVAHGNGERVMCEVTEQWRPCYTKHKLQVSDKPANLSFIGVWPDTKGLGRYVDIKKIEVQVDRPFDVEIAGE
ncbi:MAG: hypothetical protein JKY46_05870 [Robiginitomaculum sp.]|nr:hypothetical protein [Robiginitomaculum sp.]